MKAPLFHLHGTMEYTEAVGSTGKGFISDCIAASLQKPCDIYQETRGKRSARLHEGQNNALQLGHEILSDCSM